MFTVINMWNTVLIIIIRILYFKLVSNRQGHRVGTGLRVYGQIRKGHVPETCPDTFDRKQTSVLTTIVLVLG